MRRQIELLICAIQFMTRLPTPALPGFEPFWISRAAKYFPVVGQLVGAVSAAVLVVGSRLWGLPTAAAMAIVAAILVTGAFHEDGLADTADGFGGGADRAQRLLIMKDSRIGTYGALALIASFALRILALSQFPVGLAAPLLVLGHGASRCGAVMAMHALPYAGDPDHAKIKPTPMGVTWREVVIATALAAWPVFLVPKDVALAGLVVGAACAWLLTRFAKRLIGGQTGDVLGAIEQLFEIGFWLGALAAVRELA